MHLKCLKNGSHFVSTSMSYLIHWRYIKPLIDNINVITMHCWYRGLYYIYKLPVTPCHYLIGCQPIISKILRNTFQLTFICNVVLFTLNNVFENKMFETQDQWIKWVDVKQLLCKLLYPSGICMTVIIHDTRHNKNITCWYLPCVTMASRCRLAKRHKTKEN